MSTRRIALAGVLAASAIVASAPAAAQAQTCWDFATLDQSQIYRVGDLFRAPTATIEMKHILQNGVKVVTDASKAYANQSQIAGGPAPEFRMYQINAHVVPDTPVSSLSYRFALYYNAAGVARANLGVNGELLETTTGMSFFHNRVLGDPAVGTVLVTVNITTPPGASPEKGTVQLQAQTGQIEKWTHGGLQKYIDDVCFP